ncbi:Prefoldin subunit-domain-containing protein, partial [Dimargaris cristalligena]
QMESNPRGIPLAPFIENVGEYLQNNESAEITLKKFAETLSKYKFMENNTMQRKASLEGKVPEIKKTLAMVDFLISKQESGEVINTQFELHDTCYAKARVESADKVYLWLGANVMLEYSLTEAQALLKDKLATATKTLETTSEDVEFLREQVTTMEVNTARVYNWDVKQRQEER